MPDDRTNKVSCNHFTHAYEIAFELLSGKWIPQIIWNLADGNTKRFGELRKLIPGVTQKMFSQQLRLLEKNNLLIRTVLPEVPPAVEYALSEAGLGLVPVIKDMHQWSLTFLAGRTLHKHDFDDTS